MITEKALRVTAVSAGSNGGWVGAWKEGRKTVWTCGHVHYNYNRDQDRRTYGGALIERSAFHCAERELRLQSSEQK